MTITKFKCIIFCGLKMSGKDTCCNYLVQEDPNKYFHTAFANAVKDECSKVYGVERSLFDDTFLKEKIIQEIGLSPRDMCLIIGKQGRDLYLDFWIDKTIKEIKENSLHKQIILISDCRFPNEMQALKNYFGSDNVLTVWVSRFSVNPSTDETENSLSSSDCSMVITNKGTEDDLFRQLDEIC